MTADLSLDDVTAAEASVDLGADDLEAIEAEWLRRGHRVAFDKDAGSTTLRETVTGYLPPITQAGGTLEEAQEWAVRLQRVAALKGVRNVRVVGPTLVPVGQESPNVVASVGPEGVVEFQEGPASTQGENSQSLETESGLEAWKEKMAEKTGGRLPPIDEEARRQRQWDGLPAAVKAYALSKSVDPDLLENPRALVEGLNSVS